MKEVQHCNKNYSCLQCEYIISMAVNHTVEDLSSFENTSTQKTCLCIERHFMLFKITKSFSRSVANVKKHTVPTYLRWKVDFRPYGLQPFLLPGYTLVNSLQGFTCLILKLNHVSDLHKHLLLMMGTSENSLKHVERNSLLFALFSCFKTLMLQALISFPVLFLLCC